MGHLDKFIASHFPVGGPRQTLRRHLSVAANLATRRSTFSHDPEHLEEAIRRTRDHLDFLSVDDPERGEIIRTLAQLVRRRALGFGDTSVRHRNDPVVDDLPSFLQLAASLAESNTVNPHPMTTKECRRHLQAIISAGRITDEAGIEKVVQYGRLLRLSLQRSSNRLTDFTLLEMGDLLKRAFDLTNKPKYLNESIGIYRSILEGRHAQWMHVRLVLKLFFALLTRLNLSQDRDDLDQMFQLSTIISDCTYAKAHERFTIMAALAFCSRDFRHPLTTAIYNGAITLMNESLVFAPTLKLQHFRLQNGLYETLPLDYASYQVQQGQVKEAIEILEQGRGLVWSEMRGFRTSIDQLCAVNSHLAEEFAAVNRELEVLTTSASPGVLKGAVGVGDEADEEEMGSLNRVLAEHRKLLHQRNGLIAQIRALPDLENFLMASPFDTLRSAAACGPVIIINHSKWRSDIIILLYNSPPSLIPTTDNFYDRAECLGDQLLAARKKVLDSMEYEDTLISVLETLYDLVGQPVIRRLQELNVPEQSRIWWCPTSVFCSLPLHAMGPIQSDGPHKLYFSDLYIPSYTPTLTALIDSRKSGAHSSEKPSILLVAQPDESMPRARDEISLIRRLETAVTPLISKKATPSAVALGLRDHRFAHFSCHGILETGKPFDASFKLYQGKRLTLLEIIQYQLPSAEFAFLSACHTAELTEKSTAGEGLHLTAAVQFAGFRSVVGTMWAMADIDGHGLAKHFYASVFSERRQDVPYYERTAEALRDAVRELRRKKKMTAERWVNFVHYGA
jgi:CHAT domain-containing protein